MIRAPRWEDEKMGMAGMRKWEGLEVGKERRWEDEKVRRWEKKKMRRCEGGMIGSGKWEWTDCGLWNGRARSKKILNAECRRKGFYQLNQPNQLNKLFIQHLP